MKYFSLPLIFCLFSLYCMGQSNVETQIQLITPDLIGEMTVDKEPCFAWIKKVKEDVESHLISETGNKEVLVLVTLHKENEASIHIGARPELSDSSIQILLHKINEYESPRTIITDFSFALIAKINEGCKNEELKITPAVLFPAEQRVNDFIDLPFEDKGVALQEWIKNEVLPIIELYETSVDPKFEGVLAIGETVSQKKYIDTEIEELTFKNYNYWRAIMEMSTGNQLIPFTKVCMHMAKGEFDIANRLLQVINYFTDESTIGGIYFEEIATKLSIMNNELYEKINAGIALHDQGKYTEAIEHYSTILQSYPNSAWLNYEIYYSKTGNLEDPEKANELWDASKDFIYKCDPMYPLNVHASTGEEAYLLYRRQEINSLFKSRETLKKDLISYADIALDLKNYGFAGQLYWMILSHLPKEDYDNRNILAHYLYCLHMLGDDEVSKNFKGNFKSEFKQIEKERKKLMEENIFYNSFKK